MTSDPSVIRTAPAPSVGEEESRGMMKVPQRTVWTARSIEAAGRGRLISQQSPLVALQTP